MLLEKISRIPNTTDAFRLEFENGTKMKCFVENVADFSLASGMELDGERYTALLEAAAFSRTRRRAARLAASRPISEGELKTKLVMKGESPEHAAAAAERLVNAGAVDDAACAESIVRRCAAKGYGPAEVKRRLASAKIPRELWDEAMEGLGDQSETLDRLLRARIKTGDRQELSRAGEYLARRGFGWDDIRSALRRFGEISEDEE
ncbi:MAG: recombination regulator RecX [Oscillospiraceae bacterium]|nr:recombination regulator RecX [Oscillospiraceae bacterium]